MSLDAWPYESHENEEEEDGAIGETAALPLTSDHDELWSLEADELDFTSGMDFADTDLDLAHSDFE